MLNKYPPSFLYKMADSRYLLFLLALVAGFSGFIMPALEADIKTLSGGVGVLDLEFFYTPQKALEMLRAYGPEGSRLYLIAQWTVDLIFPLAVGLFLSSALVWAGKPAWWRLGALLTLADWIENVFVTVLLLQLPQFSETIAWGSCFFTMLKWALFAFCNSAILFLILKKWRRQYLVSPS